MNRSRKIEILSVDDNEADRNLLKMAFSSFTAPHNLTFVSDGDEALQLLQKDKPFTNVPTPDVILIDLNMPRKDGRELLKAIKSNPKLAPIPVIVLSTSKYSVDIAAAYALGASGFICKPADLTEFQNAMNSFEAYWLQTNVYPSEPGKK